MAAGAMAAIFGRAPLAVVVGSRWRRGRTGGVVVIEYDTWAWSLYANCVPPYGAARDGWTVGCGAMAQLVARLHGMQKVRGSNPLSSTAFRTYVRMTRTKPRT